MTCEDDISADFGLYAEYAASDGSINDESVAEAQADFADGILTPSEVGDIADASRNGCELADGVSVSDLSAVLDGRTATATATFAVPGDTPAVVVIEFTADGSTYDTVEVRTSGSDSVSASVDLTEGDHTICGDVVAVRP